MSRLLHKRSKEKKQKPPKQKKAREPFAISPKRDWMVFFIVGVTLNFLVLGIHAFIFFKITKGDLFKTNEFVKSETRTVNRELLSETLDYFRDKEERLSTSVATPPPVPSVE